MSKPLEKWTLKELLEATVPPIGYHECYMLVDEMARRLRKLDERHTVRRHSQDGMRTCWACGLSWPCPDRRILEGREP